MADNSAKASKNVPGKFYVDVSCIDCGQCHDVAPDFYVEDPAVGAMYVCKQPKTAEEIDICKQALEVCPVGAIGDDGDV